MSANRFLSSLANRYVVPSAGVASRLNRWPVASWNSTMRARTRSSSRFAKEDKKRFADILQAGSESNPYYTNSSQLPVGFTDDPFEALERQEDLQRKYTGGTVLHLYMTEPLSSAEAC